MTTKAQASSNESAKPPLTAEQIATAAEAKQSTPLPSDSAEDDWDDIDWKDVRLPFWNISQGALIMGQVVDIHRNVKGKFHNRDCIDISIARDTVVSAGKKTTRPALKGEVVRLEVRAAMGQLADIVEIGDKVRIQCTGKVPTDKGNDAWTFEVKHASGEKSAAD